MADGMPKGVILSRKIKFCVGLPASGKTQWSKKFCIDNPDWVRVSRDDLRNMRGIYWLPKQEDMITEFEQMTTAIALASGKNVIIDATNLHKTRRGEFVERVKQMLSDSYLYYRASMNNIQIEIEEQRFDISIEECIRRDALRAVDKGRVGKKVIMDMARKAGMLPVPPVYQVENENLPQGIIVDIDGTIAKNITGRGFYDYSRVSEDGVVDSIADLVRMYKIHGYKIIMLSGRDSVCRPETTNWLNFHDIPFNELWMRAEGDMRKDSTVKMELFYNNIHNRINPLFVLDDRDQVVKMWREEIGLKCLQVAYGDF